MSQLLIEYLPFQFSPMTINESIAQNNGRLVLEGCIQRANYKNGNGRVYPRNVLEGSLANYQKLIDQNNAVGELDHSLEAEVMLKNASHKITKIWWEGDDVMGRIEVMTTPSGNIVTELYKCGVNVGISSRAMGVVQKVGEDMHIQPGLVIATFDLVSTPSTHGAFMTGINESLSGVQSYKFESIHHKIHQILAL